MSKRKIVSENIDLNENNDLNERFNENNDLNKRFKSNNVLLNRITKMNYQKMELLQEIIQFKTYIQKLEYELKLSNK